jgi:hypothetical protein
VIGNVTGNADTTTKWATSRTITLAGDLSGSVSIDGTSNVTLTAIVEGNTVALGTDTTGNYIATAGVTGNGLTGSANGEGSIFTVSSNATSSSTPSTIVFRDGDRNFSANTVTANLTGDVTGNLIGNTSGTHTGPVVGNVTGSIYAQGGRILLSDGSASAPSIAFYNDGAQDTGLYWGGDGYIRIANNGQYSGQFGPGGNLSLNGTVTATFNGNLTGNVTGNLTGDVVGSITGNAQGSASNIRNLGTVTAESNGTAEPSNQLTLRNVYNNGYPTAYGNVITLGGQGGGELLVGWAGSTGSHADNYVRSRRDTGTTWSPWAKILTDQNFGNLLATVATSGSYTDLSNKPTIPAPTASPQAQLQNIVKTIIGSIDVYTTSSAGSGLVTGYSSITGAYSGWTTGTNSGTGVTSASTYLGNRTGSVYLVVDLVAFLGLSNNPSDLTYKFNYDLVIMSSLTRITDMRIDYYGMGQQTWGVQVIPLGSRSQWDANYGKFQIVLTIGNGDHWYHGTNIQAGWIGIGSRTNNVYTP